MLSRAGSPSGRNGTADDPLSAHSTMELPTDADDEVASWIAAGTPPICFGFGSIGVESAADTLAMIRRGLRAVRRAGADLRRRNGFQQCSSFPTTSK